VNFIIFILSMAVLIKGADIIIKESEKIAFHYNISEYVIGATLIAVGTSLPEMAASITASYNHKPQLAVSNVLGSVTLNITMVLGIVFLFSKKIEPKRDIFAKDSTWAIIPLFVFGLTVIDGVITIIEGVFLLFLMIGYILFLSQETFLLTQEIDVSLKKEKFSWIKSLLLLAIGFVFVIKGADYTIISASDIAKQFGVSQWLIGLFLIAFGTSLPELIVSVVAAFNGKADMSIGNIIGSNIANFTVVLGGAAAVNPLVLDIKTNFFDIAMVFCSTIILVFLTANKLYNKSAGISLLILLGLFIYNGILESLK